VSPAQCGYHTIPVSRVEGSVSDPYGQPIPNAKVELKRDNERIAAATTNEQGEFSIQAPAGRYELRATSQPFAPGYAYIGLGSDLATLFRSSHLWMILTPGLVIDQCTLVTTSRKGFESAVQRHKQELEQFNKNHATQK
jgi:Carboxypeptidase regulatory-like domain